MPRIVVIGGGIVGLSAALMLARAGHDVTVLERDDAAMPGSPQQAWQAWQRHGVAQFRQPHFLHAAGCHLLDEALPEVAQALLQAGGTPFDVLSLLPPFIDRPRAARGRRPVRHGHRPPPGDRVRGRGTAAEHAGYSPGGVGHRAGDRPGGRGQASRT